MKRNLGLALAVGTFVVAACGTDGGDTPFSNGAAGTDTNAGPISGGPCGKGELDVGTGELHYCAPIDADDSCPSTDQLVGFTSVNGDLSIYPGTSADLSAASCLHSAGTLSVSGGSSLTSLEGLDSLANVKALEVVGMDVLTSLSGIETLSSVNAMTINNNLLLSDLQGLPSGFAVGSLYVVGNPELVSLDGLANITVTELIAFENNVKLSSCKVAAFAEKFPDAELSNFGNLTEDCD
jgi:hypothetical protein